MTKDFKVKRLHQGQKRAYGDSFYEYEVISDFPVEDVEKYCTTELRKAIPKNQYLTDLRGSDYSMEKAFRPYYILNKTDDNKYFYQVTETYTD